MESASIPWRSAQFNKYALTIDETAAKLARNQRFFAHLGAKASLERAHSVGAFCASWQKGITNNKISKMVAFQAWPLDFIWILSLADIPPKVNRFPPRTAGRAQQKRRPGVFPAARVALSIERAKS